MKVYNKNLRYDYVFSFIFEVITVEGMYVTSMHRESVTNIQPLYS